MGKPNSEDQVLSKLVRNLSAGEYLYRQGDMGNTMFLILEGTVHLFHQNQQSERLVWTLSTGDVIGEKILFGGLPYKRSTTAQAKTNVSAIEFDSKHLKAINAKFPDFTIRVLKMMSERLDQANELISILQSKDDVERIMNYLTFFGRVHSSKTPAGLEIVVTAMEIAHVVNAPEHLVGNILEELKRKNLLRNNEKGYVIIDAESLQEVSSDMKQKMAA